MPWGPSPTPSTGSPPSLDRSAARAPTPARSREVPGDAARTGPPRRRRPPTARRRRPRASTACPSSCRAWPTTREGGDGRGRRRPAAAAAPTRPCRMGGLPSRLTERAGGGESRRLL
ncbi:hypothetical protein ONE63_003937 [Megalurothrips usitatus]|uniref:Uncharacterized protein n=1 Tax=Megalurothrips usitatus TaxID=439358 RepID=A0AAV7X872_9NEOP|nr:hypothetical protein ONE63_003937 [Megalurothrips usitatus]